MKYKTIIGAITRPILTGSVVGVMAAARMAINTMAILHWETKVLALIIPRLAKKYITSGNSNVTPIQNIIVVTKL